jgi:hypothetical protein
MTAAPFAAEPPQQNRLRVRFVAVPRHSGDYGLREDAARHPSLCGHVAESRRYRDSHLGGRGSRCNCVPADRTSQKDQLREVGSRIDSRATKAGVPEEGRSQASYQFTSVGLLFLGIPSSIFPLQAAHSMHGLAQRAVTTSGDQRAVTNVRLSPTCRHRPVVVTDLSSRPIG